MSDNSAIEWTDASWNPIRARNLKTGKIGWHCEHATTGCEFCYAEGINKRLGTGLPFKPGHRADIEIFLDEEMLLAPLRWKKPRKIFVGSMTDLFADFVTDEMLDKIFAVAALASQHALQFLTKRAARMRAYMLTAERKQLIAEQAMHISNLLARAAGSHEARIKLDHFSACFAGAGPFRNIWLGVSCERQEEADERIPLLLQTPAVVRFISAEPLLGPIDISEFMWPICGWWRGPFNSYAEAKSAGAECGLRRQALVHADRRFLDWVIVGGESGPHARPMHPDWARSLRDQCDAAGVAFFFKQWGEHKAEIVAGTGVDLADLAPNQCVAWGDGKTNHTRYTRVGKKTAGRLLDGREHNDSPGGQLEQQ